MRSRCTMITVLAVSFGMPNATEAARWFVDQNTPAPLAQQDGTDWETAYEDIQLLFDDDDFRRDSNPEVWVADGTYKPTAEYYDPNEPNNPPNPRNVTYVIPSGVEIYGGFRGYTSPTDPGEQFRAQRNPEVNLTNLSGDISGDDVDAAFPVGNTYSDNAYHVVTIPRAFIIGGPTRVSGFVIRGGYADGASSFSHDRGGGVKSRLLSDPEDPNRPIGNVQLNRLDLKYNYAGGGGGVYFSVKEVAYKVANCRFEHNYLAGSYGGGGLYDEWATVELMNCVFWNNHAASGYGGGANIAGILNFNLLYQSVINCTFANNSTDASPPSGGGLYIAGLVNDPEGGPPLPESKVHNSIFWGNMPDQIAEPAGDPPAIVDNSDVENGWPGPCNIDADPLFSNLSAGELQISLTSPAIDFGDSAEVLPDSTDVNDNVVIEARIPWDLDKLTRIVPVECHVDMGAYENQCICIGDIDRDGDIDLQDPANLLSCFGTAGVSCSDPCYLSDLDCNGSVELQDLSNLLSSFGTTCCPSLTGGENMMLGSDPLTQWLQTATPEDVLAWFYAGMPPIGDGTR